MCRQTVKGRNAECSCNTGTENQLCNKSDNPLGRFKLYYESLSPALQLNQRLELVQFFVHAQQAASVQK